jgi:acetyltransferase
VRGFTHLVRHAEAGKALMVTPPSLPQHFAPNTATARRVIKVALEDGRAWLDPLECAGAAECLFNPNCAYQIGARSTEAEATAAPLLAAECHRGQNFVARHHSQV